MPDAKTARQVQRQAEMLANRVKKRFKHLHKRFARRHIEVFRLYDWDIPEIRAVVDWYAGHLVVGEYTRRQSVPEWLPMMGAAAAEALGVPENRRHLKKRRAGKSEGPRYERIDHTDRKFPVRERDLQFLVNPWDFVDTGLFPDHRDTRRMVREMAAGRDFLNLYCYTGSFSCYAAKGGAKSTVSVDRAETAVAWARENFDLNGITGPEHNVVQAHTFDYLDRAKRGGKRFDLAVVDPPSYSTTESRGESFDVLTDHVRLLQAVLAVMRPAGVVLFSTNHQGFVPRLDLLGAAAVEEITHLTIPEDYVHKRKTIHRCWRISV